jgi:hypothetical protein
MKRAVRNLGHRHRQARRNGWLQMFYASNVDDDSCFIAWERPAAGGRSRPRDQLRLSSASRRHFSWA